MATVLQGAKSASFIRETIPNIPNTEDQLSYVTAQEVVGNRQGLDIVQHGKTPVSDGHTVDAGSVRRKIVSANHGAKKGWIMQPNSGPSEGEEISILHIIDENTFAIASEFPLALGDTFTLYKHITANYNADGDLNVQVTSSGPLEFHQDGVGVIVNRDTSDENNNITLPVNDFLATEAIKANQTMKFMKNGTMVEVADDTNPANVSAIPVEIKAADGTNITINAGDINVRTSSEGVNFDSMRVGNGTGNYLGITADEEALVSDLKNGVKLDAVVTAISGLNSSGLATEATLISTNSKLDLIEAANININNNVSNVNTDLNSNHTALMNYLENTQDGHLASIDTKLTGAATEATLSLINDVLSDVVTASAPATDYASATIHDRLGKIAANITALSAKFAALGKNNSANSLSVTLSNDEGPLSVSETVPNNGSQSKGVLTSGNVTTVNAPVGAVGVVIKNRSNSDGMLCWEVGGTASNTSFDLIATTSTAYIPCSAAISLYAGGGDCSYVVQWFTK